MIENVSYYIALAFGLTTVASLFLFINAVKGATAKIQAQATPIFAGLTIWLIVQAALSLGNIYSSNTGAFPPKIVLFDVLPTVFVLILLFVTAKGRAFMDSLPLKNLVLLNIVRIPVEIVLYWLFLNKAIPELMTFEGSNFDILAGLTAPFVFYFGFVQQKIGRKGLLLWHFVCLGLLFNIIFLALFSAPTPFQKFAFEQPNIAILYFPFSWLPTFIVPIVLFGHFVSIRQLLQRVKS